MAVINTTYIEKCNRALARSYDILLSSEKDSIDYEIYRSACVKEFEIILEQSGKLLKKVLKDFLHSSKEVDNLYFKDIFRRATLHGILSESETERWLAYRDSRNSTVHDYGEGFAEQTLKLFPSFIADTDSLIKAIEKQNDAAA